MYHSPRNKSTETQPNTLYSLGSCSVNAYSVNVKYITRVQCRCTAYYILPVYSVCVQFVFYPCLEYVDSTMYNVDVQYMFCMKALLIFIGDFLQHIKRSEVTGGQSHVVRQRSQEDNHLTMNHVKCQ